MVWLYFRSSRTSRITNIRTVSFCQQKCDLSGYIFCCQLISRWPCECIYVATMFPSQLSLFAVQNLPFVFHYRLFCCEGCVLHMLGINRALFKFQRQSLRVLFFSYQILELHRVSSPKNYKILSLATSSFSSVGACVVIIVKL